MGTVDDDSKMQMGTSFSLDIDDALVNIINASGGGKRNPYQRQITIQAQNQKMLSDQTRKP
jgi:hypothetical protein